MRRIEGPVTVHDGQQALEGLRVLDLSGGVAGQFCGRLFGDHGAEVVLVEPPGGSVVRRLPPFAPERESPGSGAEAESCLFWHLNLGKRSTVIDLLTGPGAASVADLARTFDVAIVDQDVPSAVRAALAGPRVLCQVSPFGFSGEWREWLGSEIVYQALSGVMFENGAPERPPLYGVGHRASYAAGVIAYTECLAILVGPERAQRVVDVAIAEVAASMNFCRATQYSYNGEKEGRDARTTPRAIVRCADGWVSVFIYDYRWAQSCKALHLEELAEDPRFVSEESRLAHWSEFTEELERHLLHQTVAEIIDAGQKEKAVVARAVLPTELRADPQLVARGYWAWDDSASRQLPRLGPMFRLAGTPQRDPGVAPRLGSGRGAGPERPDELRWHRRPLPTSTPHGEGREGTGRRPLEGTVVLDLTTAWSGPMATRVLATLGATVVKVEGPSRPDLWRGPVGGGHVSRYPERVPGRRPYDRCYQFNTQNHDKLGLAIDLKATEGRELALDIARHADVMISNFRVGTLEGLGLGWPVVSSLNPRLVMVQMPGYGEGGPISDHVALGPGIELMSAMASLIGYGDGRPVTTGPAYLDPVGGFNAAAAVLTALASRERTGVGQRLEVAQREAAMHWIGEQVVWSLATGQNAEPRGNRIEGVVPHDAFPCAGNDEWVVIAAFDDGQFRALTEVAGLPELSIDPRYSSVGARAAHEDALFEHLSDWTRRHDKHELARRLQEAGVPAAPVCNARDLAESAFLDHRGLLQELTHPEAGTHRYQGMPLHLDGIDLGIRRPAPCFGQDNESVLRSLLGLSDDDLAELAEKRVIADTPFNPANQAT
jgi:crotonobetainyl-CoA:carnitine CoA-transferase CaiB-like acyl-CoA transferase